MIRKHPIAAFVAGLVVSSAATAQDAMPQAGNTWYTDAQAAMQERLDRQPNVNVAKNVILMIADGNGVGPNYATRLYHGQLDGNMGDENVLPQEAFPHLALVKTYNTNAQTPDSSGTATALLSGVKTKSGVVGVNEQVRRGECADVAGNEVVPVTKLMSDAGKSTGIITTARLTHATPASGYASVADRDFESDADLPEGCEVADIASQLIDAMGAGWLDIAMGGGRGNFLPENVTDEEGDPGKRADGRNLVEMATAAGARYVHDDEGFSAIDLSDAGPILGLFESSHMQYELDRTGEPSLVEMVEASIEALGTNEQGFFLEVEAGRVDHANHAGNLIRTVTDGVAFAEAVARARELTDPADTLIIVTADHGHAMAFNGYCGRGTPILGLCYGIDDAGTMHTDTPELADDGQPYTVVGFLNGAGSVIRKEPLPEAIAGQVDEALGEAANDADAVAKAGTDAGAMAKAGTDAGEPAPIAADGDAVAQSLLDRLDVTTETDEDTGANETFRWIGTRGPLTQEEATDPDYLQQALIPMESETHSGEDVALYAIGPFAHLFDGTIEQNYVFNVMLHAAGLDE